MKLCVAEGCTRKHVAKGLCSTHYAKERRKTAGRQELPVETPCANCGKVVSKIPDSRYRRFCDMTCRDLYSMENGIGAWGVRRRPPRPLLCDQPSWPSWDGKFCPITKSECRICGAAFLHGPGRRVLCSKACAEKARGVRRWAMRKAKRIAIFERDGYICWMCEKRCAHTVPHPDAPTIDHLTPRSLGGDDDESNLATACFTCNSTRGASWNLPSAA